MKINLNADIGEGFGACDIGDDADLTTVIRSATIRVHGDEPTTVSAARHERQGP